MWIVGYGEPTPMWTAQDIITFWYMYGWCATALKGFTSSHIIFS